jgi:hypothetical protein
MTETDRKIKKEQKDEEYIDSFSVPSVKILTEYNSISSTAVNSLVWLRGLKQMSAGGLAS